MRIVYIDESYDKNNYVICGVVIVDMKYRKFCDEFNKFLKRTFDLEEESELKGDWLFNGRKTFKKFSMDKRAEIALKIGKFLGKSNITKFIVGYKTNYVGADKTYLEILDFIVSESAKLASKAGRTSKQLMVIFDERERETEKKIHKRLANKRREIIKKYKTSCTFFDYGYSGVSENSRMLQVADFVAYFIRNFLSTPSEDTLFTKSADKRKVDLLRKVKESIEEKMILKNL
jgi:RNase H-fold protein (predicted Holliday junction resolvase)